MQIIWVKNTLQYEGKFIAQEINFREFGLGCAPFWELATDLYNLRMSIVLIT